MIKIPKVLLLAAALLLFWGIAGFCNYTTIGQEVLRSYDGAANIREIVNYTLIQGLVKIGAGLLMPVASFFVLENKKVHTKSTA